MICPRSPKREQIVRIGISRHERECLPSSEIEAETAVCIDLTQCRRGLVSRQSYRTPGLMCSSKALAIVEKREKKIHSELVRADLLIYNVKVDSPM